MAKKNIEKVIAPRAPHFVGDGFRVHNFIPSGLTQQRTDPFIMLDYNSTWNVPAGNEAERRGRSPAPRLRNRDHRL
ncbi:hypothetical protein [Chitinophaga caseinilytica]|uniref:Uncharacterized protein n=1 Tax=Chitinophaga caseinilytica TaxID=2267521 RepID=A0ABZ2Z0T3_9BACT